MIALLTTFVASAAPGDADVPVAASSVILQGDVTTDGGLVGAALTPAVHVNAGSFRLGLSATVQRDLLDTTDLDLDDPFDLIDTDFAAHAAGDDWGYQGRSGFAGVVDAVDYLWFSDEAGRLDLRVDEFSAITLGRGTVLSRYNPHLSAASTSGQGHLRLPVAQADVWLGDLTRPAGAMGVSAAAQPLPLPGLLGSLSLGGQWVRGVGPQDVAGAELSFTPLQTDRARLEGHVSLDQGLTAGSSTGIGGRVVASTGAQGRGEASAGVRGAVLRGGFDPTDFATLSEVFDPAAAGGSALIAEAGYDVQGAGLAASVTLAGLARRAELTTTLPIGSRLSVAGTAITAGPTLTEEQALSVRGRIQPLRALTIEAGTVLTPEQVGWEASAGLTVPLGGRNQRERTVAPVAMVD